MLGRGDVREMREKNEGSHREVRVGERLVKVNCLLPRREENKLWAVGTEAGGAAWTVGHSQDWLLCQEAQAQSTLVSH